MMQTEQMNLTIPNYYNLFEIPDSGDGTVRVHFSPKSGSESDWLPTYKFPWCDIRRILDPITELPYSVMLLDDGIFQIDEYKISVIKKQITIVVGVPIDIVDL